MSVLDASLNGNLTLLKALKDKGENFSIKSKNGNNALLCACLGTGDIDTVKWLVHEGFSLEDRNNSGSTPFLAAADRGHLTILKFFKEINADIRATNNKGDNVLHRASFGKADTACIQWILDQGFSTEEKDSGGYTPVLNSAYSGRLELLKFFKEINADIRATNNKGENVLHIASVGKADTACIQWILEQGFSTEEKDSVGDTPVLNSAYSGRLELLKFFKEINADIRATNNDGDNALHRASYGEADIPTIKWLLQQGFSIETLNSDGHTPFYFAVYKGHKQLVRFFLDIKPDLLNKTSESR